MNCSIIVKAKYTLPMNDGLDIIKDGAVVIDRNSIKAVGKAEELENKYTAEKVMDVGNSILLPGLINTHTHAAMSYFRGLADDLPLQEWLEKHIWPAEAENLDENFIEEASDLACLEMIKSGTTCFNDMYFFAYLTAQASERAGIRAVLGETALNFPTKSCQTYQIALNKTEYLAKESQSELISVSVCPHSIYICSQELLSSAKNLSDKYNLPIHIHISETKKEVDDCRQEKGMSPVEYLDSINFLNDRVVAAHSVWLDDKDISIYAERGVKVSHNTASNMKLGSGFMPLVKFQKKNIAVSLGTDGVASNNRMDMFDSMRMCALVHKAVNLNPMAADARAVVKMATINGAQTLGQDKKIGSLEVGKRADLIAVSLAGPHLTPIFDPYSHLVYCATGNDVTHVIINGQIVMSDRSMKTLDEEQILFKAREYWK